MLTSTVVPKLWSAGGSAVSSYALVASFLTGVSVFIYRDHIPLNGRLLAISILLTYVMLYNGTLQYLAAIPVTYATVYLGLTDFRKTIITATGDYSYGVYLYGFPVQQLIAYEFPSNRYFVMNFLGALCISLMLAALS